MFSQKEVNSPLAEKRIVYSLLRRGIFGRRCYSESTPATHKHKSLSLLRATPAVFSVQHDGRQALAPEAH